MESKSPLKSLPVRGRASGALEGVPSKIWRRNERIAQALRSLGDTPMTHARAVRLGLRFGVHRATIYRYRSRLAGIDEATAIAGRTRGWKPLASRLSAKQEQAIEEAVNAMRKKQRPHRGGRRAHPVEKRQMRSWSAWWLEIGVITRCLLCRSSCSGVLHQHGHQQSGGGRTGHHRGSGHDAGQTVDRIAADLLHPVNERGDVAGLDPVHIVHPYMQVGPAAAKSDFCEDAVGDGHQCQHPERLEQVCQQATAIWCWRCRVHLADELRNRDLRCLATKQVPRK